MNAERLNHRVFTRVLLASILLLCTCLLFKSRLFSDRRVLTRNSRAVQAARNSTLGFEAIILISLDSRTDRQDAISLIASSVDIKITKVVSAVKGEDISEKAMPGGSAKAILPKPYLGSWRSHMDAFKFIVDNRIQTALIIEDDVDWDIHLKSQMVAFAQGLRSSPLRSAFSPYEQAEAPYGLDWDIIHFGTSRNGLVPPPQLVQFHRYTDTHVMPQEFSVRDEPCITSEFFCWSDILKAAEARSDERVLLPSYAPVGLAAIGVSFSGAQRLLYQLSWKNLESSTDFAIRDCCSQGLLTCWSMVPPIMSTWRTGGFQDSDLRQTDDMSAEKGHQKSNIEGNSPGLAWSARVDLANRFEAPSGFWLPQTQ